MQGFFHSSEVQKERPTGLVPRCGACGLYKGCHSPKMEPYGAGAQGVLIVGEAPGETEDDEDRPFVGKAGQFLRGVLSGIGVNMDKAAVTTNALICRPPHNEEPKTKQLEHCHPNLVRTIKENSPRVIITLGHPALVTLLQGLWTGEVGPMEKWAGWRIPYEKFWICPTYHPSYLLRSHSDMLDRIFEAHLEAAFELDEAPEPREDYEKQVEVIYDDHDAANAILELDREGGWAAVDFETNCLKPEYEFARALSFSISNGRRTIAYPWVGEAVEATSAFLKSDRTQKIASNLKMEERWTRKLLGHGITNWGWDTMLAAHCLDNRPGICSLKFQAFIKLGVASYNTNVEPYLASKKGTHYNREAEIAPKRLLLYNGMDSLLEHRVAMVQREEMGYARA
jgi:uracil-DNA glycosylase family 4